MSFKTLLAYLKGFELSMQIFEISKTLENSETQVWLQFAGSSGYISVEVETDLSNKCEEIGKLIII
ncbi:four helix bundle protein [Aequorivita vitellina]|uniref:four helix bundle protein n=1 Tax=Aequorivita vitellina TaxID=2874475 RepID=UPI0030BA18BC